MIMFVMGKCIGLMKVSMARIECIISVEVDFNL